MTHRLVSGIPGLDGKMGRPGMPGMKGMTGPPGVSGMKGDSVSSVLFAFTKASNNSLALSGTVLSICIGTVDTRMLEFPA